MLILLPPSEGKTAPADGDPVDLEALPFPELTPARRRVGKALIATSGQRNALSVLGAGPSLAEAVARNTTLWANPSAPAAQVYSGVLYDAAGAADWDADTMARAAQRVRILSALWGAISPADEIPAYRLSMCSSLGRMGAVTAHWRKHLAPTLTHETRDHLIIDCRSSDYAAVWKPPPGTALTVRVEREFEGRRSAVSHAAKHTRGLLTAALVATAVEPTTGEAVAELAAQIPGISSVELRPGSLTLVTTG